jgi:phosphomannomutase
MLVGVDPQCSPPSNARLKSIVPGGTGGRAILLVVLSNLRSILDYMPVELRFGTSGRRGKVVDLTQLEVYANALGELRYLQSLEVGNGGIVPGDEFYFAHDLRPSSVALVPEEGGRGEICQAVVQAILDAGMRPVNLGPIPTPALAAYAFARRRGSIMVTGSHIPFELNGYKLNTSAGEILKEQEAPITESVARVREALYAESADSSAFDERGMFRGGPRALPAPDHAARTAYIERYVSFFAEEPLRGKRILAYQHSAVGRDLLVEILAALGADVVPAGRSDTFVAIDTEAIGAAELATIQNLADQATANYGDLWAVVSTDGDSDRPLLLGVDSGKVRFFGGDLVGMVTAQFLGTDAVVVPVTCNDGIDRGALADRVEPKTRVGSPFVIAGMDAALAKGRKSVCGWEANGGFLLGSAVSRNGRELTALPTRDAMLPILAPLCTAAAEGVGLVEIFARLPKRFSRAALKRPFPRETGKALVEFLKTENAVQLGSLFPEDFPPVATVDTTDGVRIRFENGDVVHFRPSGNADEFRIYAVADTPERAEAIVKAGLAEPDGIIRRIEHAAQLAA